MANRYMAAKPLVNDMELKQEGYAPQYPKEPNTTRTPYYVLSDKFSKKLYIPEGRD
ncbi:MAG: hypothetical protein IPP74_09245 [Alphaproteobacteria bacterium]|nr:hypothetical protein [Alphaproteobacteria bacterium]